MNNTKISLAPQLLMKLKQEYQSAQNMEMHYKIGVWPPNEPH
jgi:hypothetical protein